MGQSASEQVDAIIKGSTDWRGETLSRLRRLITHAAPGLVEEVKWKKPSRPEGIPVWSREGIVCTGEMLKNAVRLTFPRGAEVKDPAKVFNARLDSASVRAIDVYEGEKVREAALKAIVAGAAKLNVDSAKANGATGRKQPTAAKAAKDRISPAPPSRRASTRSIPGGPVHELPSDLRGALIDSPAALKAWMDITPLARNEFICWVQDAKQAVTRERRVRRTQEELEEGQRRPCCWPGCKHRDRNGR